MSELTDGSPVPAWSRKKKDAAPRGVFKHPSGVWAIRYACGAGCEKHEERVGPLKSDAIRAHAARRQRVHEEPTWCPAVERRQARERAQAEQDRERSRVTFREYSTDYLEWSKKHKRSWSTDQGMFTRLLPVLGDKKLDAITTAEVERFRDSLLDDDVSRATANRYRDLLSGMFRRAIRLGHVTSNPVTPVQKFKESGGRIAYLTAEQEAAIFEALPVELRPLFVA